MKTVNLVKILILAGGIRYFFMISTFSAIIQNRVEISTPINSWKRVQEGAYLYEKNIDPYTGDIYHENPLILIISNFLIKYFKEFIPFIFILIDLLTGFVLYLMSKAFTKEMYDHEQKEKVNYAKDSTALHMDKNDKTLIPLYTLIIYLFNPYIILNCVGLTTTVYSNLFLAVHYLFLIKKYNYLTLIFLIFEIQKNFYPIVLIMPTIFYLTNNLVSFNEKLKKIVKLLMIFVGLNLLLNFIYYKLLNNWNFIDATYGFILNCRDLQPNIGLFWYFFTEVFDHFRTLFLYSFQINATILYLIPLCLKFNNYPIMLSTILTTLNTIFRSYPCIGDIGFYMALLTLWKNPAKYMKQKFVVGGFFLVTSVLGPIVWHLWLYSHSGNANFFFGVTLTFVVSQIYLITDLSFAFCKREFCLKNGVERTINGKEAILTMKY